MASRYETGPVTDHGFHQTIGPDGTAQPGDSTTSLTPVGTRVSWAMAALQDKGYTPEQAAGIVGNWMAESGGNLNPDQVQGQDMAYRPSQTVADLNPFSTNLGYGITQATDDSRKEKMAMALAGMDPSTGAFQGGLNAAIGELGAYPGFQRAATPYESTRYGLVNYEAPKDRYSQAELAKRLGYADTALGLDYPDELDVHTIPSGDFVPADQAVDTAPVSPVDYGGDLSPIGPAQFSSGSPYDGSFSTVPAGSLVNGYSDFSSVPAGSLANAYEGAGTSTVPVGSLASAYDGTAGPSYGDLGYRDTSSSWSPTVRAWPNPSTFDNLGGVPTQPVESKPLDAPPTASYGDLGLRDTAASYNPDPAVRAWANPQEQHNIYSAYEGQQTAFDNPEPVAAQTVPNPSFDPNAGQTFSKDWSAPQEDQSASHYGDLGYRDTAPQTAETAPLGSIMSAYDQPAQPQERPGDFGFSAMHMEPSYQAAPMSMTPAPEAFSAPQQAMNWQAPDWSSMSWSDPSANMTTASIGPQSSASSFNWSAQPFDFSGISWQAPQAPTTGGNTYSQSQLQNMVNNYGNATGYSGTDTGGQTGGLW